MDNCYASSICIAVSATQLLSGKLCPVACLLVDNGVVASAVFLDLRPSAKTTTIEPLPTSVPKALETVTNALHKYGIQTLCLKVRQVHLATVPVPLNGCCSCIPSQWLPEAEWHFLDVIYITHLVDFKCCDWSICCHVVWIILMMFHAILTSLANSSQTSACQMATNGIC